MIRFFPVLSLIVAIFSMLLFGIGYYSAKQSSWEEVSAPELIPKKKQLHTLCEELANRIKNGEVSTHEKSIRICEEYNINEKWEEVSISNDLRLPFKTFAVD